MATDLLDGLEAGPAALLDVATVGLKSMEHLVNLASQQKHAHQQVHSKELSDFIIPLKKAISSNLNRSGHALFRRAPVQPPPTQIPPLPPKTLTLDLSKVDLVSHTNMKVSDAPLMNSSATTSVFRSSLTGNGSLSNASLAVEAKKPKNSVGKPPLGVKKCREHDHSGKKCHCKKRIKRTIKVPATGPKVVDIPADEYSWRKYGQKPIKGSAFPRGYYRCSIVKGCPARKHVERATDDSMMLIVSYTDEHNHTQEAKKEIPTPPSTGSLMVFGSTS